MRGGRYHGHPARILPVWWRYHLAVTWRHHHSRRGSGGGCHLGMMWRMRRSLMHVHQPVGWVEREDVRVAGHEVMHGAVDGAVVVPGLGHQRDFKLVDEAGFQRHGVGPTHRHQPLQQHHQSLLLQQVHAPGRSLGPHPAVELRAHVPAARWRRHVGSQDRGRRGGVRRHARVQMGGTRVEGRGAHPRRRHVHRPHPGRGSHGGHLKGGASDLSTLRRRQQLLYAMMQSVHLLLVERLDVIQFVLVLALDAVHLLVGVRLRRLVLSLLPLRPAQLASSLLMVVLRFGQSRLLQLQLFAERLQLGILLIQL
mmetsp:Transcript_21492/g.40972  ORF Transcript_21492/g.40972 Transcript_21492/m.40972 type:complete len:310 (-) Transcript_21492:852-1781(-)